MYRWSVVMVLVLLVLASAMGLKALTTHPTLAVSGGPVPPWSVSGGPVPPWAVSGGPVPPWSVSGGPVPPWSISTDALNLR
jgi:hypothetical protein